jgi:hypothetical protein
LIAPSLSSDIYIVRNRNEEEQSMVRLTTWPTIVGTAALVAMPVIAAAQTTGTTPHTPTTEPQTETRTSTTETDSPRAHLAKAKQALDEVPRNAVTGKKASKLNELRRHIAALDKNFKKDDVPGSATADAQRSERGRERAAAGADKSAKWSSNLNAADRALNELLGEQSGQSADSARTETGTAGTTGTTGSARSDDAERDALDPEVRMQLQEVRRHLTAFAASASGTTASGTMGSTGTAGTTSSPDSTTPPTSPTPDPTQPDPTPQPTEPTQPSTSGTTGSTSGTTETTPRTSASQSGQANVEAAREHLSQARQALADLTALPQAQQLTGEARNHVSQLISQFNTLITTEENWQNHYQEVNQTLMQLLSAQASPGTTADTPDAPATGTTGAVGTSGSAQAEIDPAIRNQLMQFRTHLQAFHAAASGSGGAASSATGATSGSMTGMTSGTTSGTASSTTTSETSPATTTTGSAQTGTPAGAQTGTQASSQAGSSEVERHIAAIERILNEAAGTAGGSATGSATTGTTSGTTPGTTSGTATGSTSGTAGTPSTGTAGMTAGGSVTLDRAKVEEIRRHLEQLRQAARR